LAARLQLALFTRASHGSRNQGNLMNKSVFATVLFACACAVGCTSTSDNTKTITGSLSASKVASVQFVAATGVVQSASVSNGAFSLTVPSDVAGVLLFKDASGNAVANLVSRGKVNGKLSAIIPAGAALKNGTVALGTISVDDSAGSATSSSNCHEQIDSDDDGVDNYDDSDDDGDGSVDDTDRDDDGDGHADSSSDDDSDDDGQCNPVDHDDDNDGLDDSTDSDDDGDGIDDSSDHDSDHDGIDDDHDLDDDNNGGADDSGGSGSGSGSGSDDSGHHGGGV
jgi:hypothetical protein